MMQFYQTLRLMAHQKNFVSSTKAECFALLTALIVIVCPPNSRVEIYTDSLCLINTFNKIFNSYIPPRRFLKLIIFNFGTRSKLLLKHLILPST
jgi:hypothetical protein